MGWAIVFLIAAIVAAIIGFGVLVAAAAAIAKILFFILLVMFAIKMIAHFLRRA